MFKSIFIKATVVAIACSSFAASANTVIDLFSDNQAKLEVGVGEVAFTDFSSAGGANIIGGNRDIEVTAGTFATASAQVVLDQLVIASNAFATTNNSFNVTIQWDGADATAGLDTMGLGAQDLSDLVGFQVDILSSDGSGTFDVSVWSDAGTESATITLPFIPVPAMSPTSFVVNFGLLLAANPSLDLSSISAIQLSVNGSGDTDIRVAAINAVPEPSSLAIMGLALLGFSAMSRRKTKK